MTTIFLLCSLAVSSMYMSVGYETVKSTDYKQTCTVYDTAKEAAIANYHSASGRYLDTTKLYRLDLKAKTMTDVTMPKVRLEVEDVK